MDILSVVLSILELAMLAWLIVLGYLWSAPPLPRRAIVPRAHRPAEVVEYVYRPPVSPNAQLARRLVAMELAELARLSELQSRAGTRLVRDGAVSGPWAR